MLFFEKFQALPAIPSIGTIIANTVSPSIFNFPLINYFPPAFNINLNKLTTHEVILLSCIFQPNLLCDERPNFPIYPCCAKDLPPPPMR
ncbi:MAG: hypothetical protein AAB316_18690 [Bacteroidota bacterium]